MKYLALLLAVLCLGVSLAEVVLTGQARELQGQYEQRQAVINEDATYRQLNDQFIKALANAAAALGDESIRQMLASEGVTFTVGATAPVSEAPMTETGESASDE